MFVLLQCFPSPFPFTTIKQTLRNFPKEANHNLVKRKIGINCFIIVQMLFLGVGLVTLLGLLYLSLCGSVRYVAFNTSLNLLSKNIKKSLPRQSGLTYFSFIMLALFLSECEVEQIILIIISENLNFRWVAYFVLKFSKIISLAIFVLLSICLFSIAVTPASYTLCIVIFQIGCISFTKCIPSWLPTFLITLSNDIHVNPGPHFRNTFLIL